MHTSAWSRSRQWRFDSQMLAHGRLSQQSLGDCISPSTRTHMKHTLPAGIALLCYIIPRWFAFVHGVEVHVTCCFVVDKVYVVCGFDLEKRFVDATRATIWGKMNLPSVSPLPSCHHYTSSTRSCLRPANCWTVEELIEPYINTLIPPANILLLLSVWGVQHDLFPSHGFLYSSMHTIPSFFMCQNSLCISNLIGLHLTSNILPPNIFSFNLMVTLPTYV